MDTKDGQGSRTHRLVRWLKDKIEKRRDDRDDHDPWWVTLMLDVGRPAVAIMILTMCAPGEHYLMLEARFHDPFAWLGPGTLTAYAGIAAVTATKRPKGSPGHATAVLGAVLSIALAMAAQPIAHLWGVQGITTERIWLIIVVSSVPSAVFGHLLHMGAAPTAKRRTPKADKRPDKRTGRGRTIALSVDTPADSVTVHPDTAQIVISGHSDSEPDTPADTGQDTPAVPDTSPSVRSIKSGSLSADVRSFLSDHPDVVDSYLSGDRPDADAKLSAHINMVRPGAAWDGVRKARDRYLDKIGKAS